MNRQYTNMQQTVTEPLNKGHDYLYKYTEDA